VWNRFYDELLEDINAREYEEDVYERSGAAKKYATNFASNIAPKLNLYATSYSTHQSGQARQSIQPSPAQR
jgi:hypothetical protein